MCLLLFSEAIVPLETQGLYAYEHFVPLLFSWFSEKKYGKVW